VTESQSFGQKKPISNASAFRWPAAVMRDRSGVADRRYPDSCLADSTYCGLASTARPFDANFYFTHAGIRRFSCCLARRLLSCERSAFSRSTKSASAGRRLCNEIAVGVGDRDHRVIERRGNVNDPVRNVLSLFLLVNLFLWCCHKLGSKSLVSSFKNFRKQPEA